MRYIEMKAAAIGQAIEEWQAEAPFGGLLALLPEAEKAQLPVLQAMCRERGIALVGGIFPALVVGERFVTEGLWLLRFKKMPPHFMIGPLTAGCTDCVDRIVREVRTGLGEIPEGGAKPTLFLLFDSMVPNIASLLDGIYLELANRVEYAGVNAGSETFQPMPCLFDQETVIGNGVLGILLPGESAPILEHGFIPPQRAMTATSTQGNRIESIDWRPAFEVYREIIRTEYQIDLTPDNFYQYAVHFPFGILRANGDVVVRIPVALTEDGALYCVGEIPENAMLVLLKAPAAGENGCVERLVTNLRAANGAMEDGHLLTFYCAGRRMHLGDTAEQELDALHAVARSATMAGALSLGEIGSTSRWGYPMFHNATLVCMPWEQQ